MFYAVVTSHVLSTTAMCGINEQVAAAWQTRLPGPLTCLRRYVVSKQEDTGTECC